MFDDPFLDELEIELKKVKGEFKEIYLENSKGYVSSREDGIDKDSKLSDCGIGVRVKRGENWLYGSLKSFSKTEMSSFVARFDEELERETKNEVPQETEESEMPPGKAAKVFDEAIASVSGKSGADFSGLIRSSVNEVAILNSEGTRRREKRERKIFYVRASAGNEKMRATGADAVMVSEKTDKKTLVDIFKKSAEEALRLAEIKLGARKQLQGEIPVVFGSRAAGFLIHEAVAHIFEADGHKKETIEKLIGEKIAADQFTLTEKGALPSFASFDDEGALPKEKILVEKGRVVSFLADRKNGAALDLEITGNARRADYRHPPLVRMWNIDLSPSELEDEELFSEINFGLYVKRVADGKVDLKKGEFSFPVVEGYLVRNGKLEELVSGIEVSGKTPRFLKEIELIGKKPGNNWFLCLKCHQALWVSERAPAFRVKKLLVGESS